MTEAFPVHGGQLREISERFEVPVSQLLDFSANINPDGPSPKVLDALRAGLNDTSVLTQYPDLQECELKESIARHAGVARQNIAVANGFVPLLEATLHALNIRSCLLPIPAFNEYQRTLSRNGITVRRYVLPQDNNFRYDEDMMLAGRQEAILLANPQNPSGVLCSRDTLMELISRAGEKGTYVLLDEAFIDYSVEESLTSETERFTNLIVFRSVTKFHGIPGLRVAYAVASAALIEKVEARLGPWLISTLAGYGVIAALDDDEYARRTRHLNKLRKSELALRLQGLGFCAYPSAANFLLFRLPVGHDAEAFWKALIIQYGIVVRSCANYEGLSAGHLRVAVRDERDNARLIEALRQLRS